MPDIWNMFTCKACGTLYVDPRPDNESLPRIYEEYFTHNPNIEIYPNSGVIGFVWRLINGYLNSQFGMKRQPSTRLGRVVFGLAFPWRQKLDYYCRHLTLSQFPSRGSLLDLGCGNGSFLKRAIEMEWDAFGCEPDPRAVEVCKSEGLDVVHGDVFDEKLNGRQFDVVTVSHVIEHVPDIKSALSRIHSIIKPGGTVWFALPNPNSVTIRLFLSAAAALHLPRHLCIPTQARFTEMLQESGFTRVRAIKRGIQTRTHWDKSIRIAAKQDLNQPNRIRLFFGRLLSEILSTVSVRWSEESVFVATKD
jgi:SAM-dependent methyltransferase